MKHEYAQMIRAQMSHSSDKTEWPCGGPFFPTTSEIGFLEVDSKTAVDAFVIWRAKIGQFPTTRVIDGGFDSGITALLPLTTIDRRRFVFFRIGTWTAYFDNGARGTDAMPVASYLAQTIGCHGLRVVSTPDGPRTYGATILEMYGPKDTDFLNYVRTISVVDDGGRWRFDTSGSPLPFEDISAYKQRRIKDRFTPDLLVRYLDALGIPAFVAEEYSHPVLVERCDDESRGVEHLIFEQAQARFTAHL